jgi:putative addiction module component (TIGR02574 family)
MQRERDEREFDELSTEQKIEYVMYLWDRIGAAADEVPVPDEVLEEIERRIDEHDRHPEDSVTWEELKLKIWGPNQ